MRPPPRPASAHGEARRAAPRAPSASGLARTRRIEIDATRVAGVTLVRAPLPHLSRAAATLVVRAGPRYETPARAGLSHFLEHMLHRGTEARLADAHAQAVAFERLGANLEAATGVDYGTLGANTPPENLLAVLDLLGEVATSPSFRDVDIERGIVREELHEDHDERGRLVDPDSLVRALAFGDHPLGLPILGTPRTLASFGVAALRRHHARHYAKPNLVLALAGRLPPLEAIEPVVRRAFGRLPKGPALGPVRPPRPVDGPRLSVVRTAASQVGVRVGFVGPGRHDADEPAVALLSRIIDDGTGTRLYERLCDRQGLAYDVSAAFEAFDDVGFFDLAAETSPPRVGRVLAELLAIAGELGADGPGDEETRMALDRARWRAAAQCDEPETLAEVLGAGALFGQPAAPRERHALLARAAQAGLAAPARRLFDPRRLAVVLVGPVSRAVEARAEKLLAAFG